MVDSSNSASMPAPLAEVYSITRPPYFNGTNYSFLKQRIIKGLEIPLVIGGTREKSGEEYTYADWKKISANAKALNILHCALDVTEYNRVLGLTYECTNQVKESKANLLVRDFELFEMKSSETIAEMSTRFTNLVNILKVLGKRFEEIELVKKILRSLPKSWKAKTTVIYDELIGSLIAMK
uniref:UBN2 domain-containing protein n=1 Tax=Manihot esculenta TaxID=3983 RepID=A0A199UCQ2_MANES